MCIIMRIYIKQVLAKLNLNYSPITDSLSYLWMLRENITDKSLAVKMSRSNASRYKVATLCNHILQLSTTTRDISSSNKCSLRNKPFLFLFKFIRFTRITSLYFFGPVDRFIFHMFGDI